MRYYTYLSEAKLAALHPQVRQRSASKLHGDLAVEVAGVSLNIRKGENAPPSIYDQLSDVEKELHQAGQVGFWHEGKPWIQGVLPLESAMYHEMDDEPTATFWSHVSDDCILALVGSAKHLVGQPPLGRTNSYSGTRQFLMWLHENIEDVPLPDWTKRPDRIDLANTVECAVENLRGPTNRSQFLAKVLFRGISRRNHPAGRPVVLATPLFVADE